MEEETEFTKLPVEDRCVHKVFYYYNFIIVVRLFIRSILSYFFVIFSHGRQEFMDMKNVRRNSGVLTTRNLLSGTSSWD